MLALQWFDTRYLGRPQAAAEEIVHSTRNLAKYDVNTASFLGILCCCGLIFGFGLPF